MLSARRMAQWVAGLLAVFLAATAVAQDNIDAGKSPAQIFADTCSACHRRPQELKRASAGFLRQHYTPGPAAASAMATYLGRVGSDPRAVEQRQERAKAQGRKGAPAAAAKTAPPAHTKAAPATHAKTGAMPKGRRAVEAAKAKTAAAAHAKSSEAHAAEQAPPARTIVLEPFEE
ncbi:MAG: hypothetical protein ACRECO_10430 [Xanthobacteraceae bacterium]